MHMSPALNESPAVECFRRGNQRSQYLFFFFLGGGGGGGGNFPPSSPCRRNPGRQITVHHCQLLLINS